MQPGCSRRLFLAESIEGIKNITLQYNFKRVILQHSKQYHPSTPFSAWYKVKTQRPLQSAPGLTARNLSAKQHQVSFTCWPSVTPCWLPVATRITKETQAIFRNKPFLDYPFIKTGQAFRKIASWMLFSVQLLLYFQNKFQMYQKS